jgi:hypothetical protein
MFFLAACIYAVVVALGGFVFMLIVESKKTKPNTHVSQ